MKIREYDLDIDILEELQEFEWNNDSIKGNKFIACSPFRSERHPSFAVNLETGTFIDSGNSDEYYHKGNLVKLLALLRSEEYEIIEDYLIEKYATILVDTETLELHINLQEQQDHQQIIDRKSITHLYLKQSDYLLKRGISVEVQTLFETGFDALRGCIALLWHDKKGNIINIKYRCVDKKSFFYAKGGQPIKNHLYGMYQCLQKKAKRVYICESEIDALTLWSHGYPAIAVGGSSLSENQKQILLTSGIEELVVSTDNDTVGNRFKEFLIGELGGYFTMYSFIFPTMVKDVNDMTSEQINKSAQSLEAPTFSFLSLS